MDTIVRQTGAQARHTTGAILGRIDYPQRAQCLPPLEIAAGKYSVRFARTHEELEAVQRLRFEVFNLELREGLDSSYLTGFDSDGFDATCHHLVSNRAAHAGSPRWDAFCSRSSAQQSGRCPHKHRRPSTSRA